MDYHRMYDLMRYESNRLRSFQMNPPWPKDYIDIKKLAKAGFFYVFSGDKVHCAFCRGEVSRWERDDDPMTEHARHFITCPFIMGGEVGNVPLSDDPIPGPKRPRAYDVCGPYPSFPPNDPRSLEERYINTNSDMAEHGRQFITCPFNMGGEVGNVPPRDDPIPGPKRPRAYDVCGPYPSSQSNEPRSLEDRNVETNSDNQNSNLAGICKICYTNSIEMVFLPCGHSVSCLSCAHRLYSCPFCRETITTRIRTYLV